VIIDDGGICSGDPAAEVDDPLSILVLASALAPMKAIPDDHVPPLPPPTQLEQPGAAAAVRVTAIARTAPRPHKIFI
jgi:hypothetical protein